MSYRPKAELSNVPAIPDHIYYDVLITNFNSTSGNPIPIYFNENRTNPIIPCTGEYEMSIIRFQVDTPDLPVFIPIIEPNQTLNDLTNYVITLTIKPQYRSDGVTANTTTYVSQASIIWITQDTSAFVPPGPSANGGYQSNVGDYYYCYSYQHFQSLVQATLVRAFTFLQQALIDDGYSASTANKEIIGILPPIFSWDSTTSCAVISTPQYKADNASPAFETRYLDALGVITPNIYGVKMYFNSPLYQLFNSFNSIFKGQSNSITASNTIGSVVRGYYQNPVGYNSITFSPGEILTGLNYEITILNQQGTNQIITPTIYPNEYPDNPLTTTTRNLFIQTFQEFSTIVNWTPVDSIVFVSNTLPIVSNQLASPLIFNENQIIAGDGNNAKFAQIITDIVTNQQSYKPNLLYNPTAEYRMISLTGNRPLTNVDISVFWRNKLGNLIPINLLSGGSCSLKFLFRKRIV
jgi:hypothetical protein